MINRIEKISKDIEDSIKRNGKMETILKWLVVTKAEEIQLKAELTRRGYIITAKPGTDFSIIESSKVKTYLDEICG